MIMMMGVGATTAAKPTTDEDEDDQETTTNKVVEDGDGRRRRATTIMMMMTMKQRQQAILFGSRHHIELPLNTIIVQVIISTLSNMIKWPKQLCTLSAAKRLNYILGKGREEVDIAP